MSIDVEPVPPIDNAPLDASMIDQPSFPNGQTRKDPPHRPTEHDKWKIIPKKISDKAQFD